MLPTIGLCSWLACSVTGWEGTSAVTRASQEPARPPGLWRRVLSGSSSAAKCHLECDAGPQRGGSALWGASFLRAFPRDEAGRESGKRKAMIFKVTANGRRYQVTLKCRKAYSYFSFIKLLYFMSICVFSACPSEYHVCPWCLQRDRTRCSAFSN